MEEKKDESTFSGWPWAMGGALAAGLIVGGVLWFVGRHNAEIQRQNLAASYAQLETFKKSLASIVLSREAESAEEMLVRGLQSRGARFFSLSAAEGKKDPHGHVVWDAENQTFWVVGAGFTPPAEGKIFQLWITTELSEVSAGTFGCDEKGKVFKSLKAARGAVPKGFAVTIEPAAGAEKRSGDVVLATAP
jgi:hypothetical protein